MCLNGADPHVEFRRDLTVRAPLSRQSGDALLSLRELRCRRRPTADPTHLAACLLTPQTGAQFVEDRGGLFERRPGRSLLLRSSPHGSHGEQRPGALERIGVVLERCQGAFHGGRSIGKLAVRGAEQTTAAGGCSDRPRTAEAVGVDLVQLEVGAALAPTRPGRSSSRWCPPTLVPSDHRSPARAVGPAARAGTGQRPRCSRARSQACQMRRAQGQCRTRSLTTRRIGGYPRPKPAPARRGRRRPRAAPSRVPPTTVHAWTASDQ